MAGLKVVLLICGDRAMQEVLRVIVASAGCRMVAAGSVAAAERRLERQRPVLILVDPLIGAPAAACLGHDGHVVEVPVRTSSSGVRRIAKHNDGAVRWLKDLVATRCRSADE